MSMKRKKVLIHESVLTRKNDTVSVLQLLVQYKEAGNKVWFSKMIHIFGRDILFKNHSCMTLLSTRW